MRVVDVLEDAHTKDAVNGTFWKRNRGDIPMEDFHVLDSIKHEPLLTARDSSLRIVHCNDSPDERLQQQDVGPSSAADIEDDLRGFGSDKGEQLFIGKAFDFYVSWPRSAIYLVIGAIIVAFVGAVILVWITRLIKKA